MAKKSKIILWLKELRAPFATASVLPVVIGSVLASKQLSYWDYTLFVLALSSIVLIHFGANIINDYFDHLSRNDWLNDNKTPFSGGTRMIQDNLLTPREILIGACILFAVGAALGIIILIKTKSLFLLLLGVIGIFGAIFYTAPPIKFGYRTAGEITIGLLFGILPVYGSYYIQALHFSTYPLPAASIVSTLIFLVIFANEFPDFEADRAVNKKTLVVILGISNAANLFKSLLIFLCALAVVYSISNLNKLASLILLIPIVVLSSICFAYADPEKLKQKGYSTLSRATILLHFIGCSCLAAAILLV